MTCSTKDCYLAKEEVEKYSPSLARSAESEPRIGEEMCLSHGQHALGY